VPGKISVASKCKVRSSLVPGSSVPEIGSIESQSTPAKQSSSPQINSFCIMPSIVQYPGTKLLSIHTPPAVAFTGVTTVATLNVIPVSVPEGKAICTNQFSSSGVLPICAYPHRYDAPVL